jgi:hypothetical protein
MTKIDALTKTWLGETTEKVAVIHAAFENAPTSWRLHLSRPTRLLRRGGAMMVSLISAPLPHVAAQALVIWS